MSAKNNIFSRENERIRCVYEERDKLMSHADWKTNIYHPRHQLGILFREHNYRILIDALNLLEIDLIPMRILDVGCGYGYWLRYLVDLGAKPENLTGIDLSRERIDFARAANPSINWILQEGIGLPFSSEAFDFVIQVVAFSSVIDEDLRVSLAKEMLRVVRPGQYILWLDHHSNLSEKLHGFSKKKVLSYFPGASIIYETQAHPRYFRRMYLRYPNLCHLIYGLSKFACDSWFLILKMEHPQND